MTDPNARPWYRHPYAWLVVGIPTVAVVASLHFVFLAVVNRDELVPGNWYQDGKAINENVAKSQAAQAQQIGALLQLDETSGEVLLQLHGEIEPPEVLSLTLVHATQSERDQTITLSLIADGQYTGQLQRPPRGRFHIDLSAQQWQIVSDVVLPSSTPAIPLGQPKP